MICAIPFDFGGALETIGAHWSEGTCPGKAIFEHTTSGLKTGDRRTCPPQAGSPATFAKSDL
jgi:hypothetical protein